MGIYPKEKSTYKESIHEDKDDSWHSKKIGIYFFLS
jgi:hypothetical protein